MKATAAELEKSWLKTIREHIRQESTQDLDGLLEGMTKDCICAVNVSPRPCVGPKAVADRYLKQWQGFPDFKVRVRRVVAVGKNYVVTENEWRGTHRGPFFGIPPTGRRARVNACVLWEFRGKKLRAEYVYYDLATVMRQLGVLEVKASRAPRPSRRRAAS